MPNNKQQQSGRAGRGSAHILHNALNIALRLKSFLESYTRICYVFLEAFHFSWENAVF